MSKEQIRKEIVFEVMKDLKATLLFSSIELRAVRAALNKNIVKVLFAQKLYTENEVNKLTKENIDRIYRDMGGADE